MVYEWNDLRICSLRAIVRKLNRRVGARALLSTRTYPNPDEAPSINTCKILSFRYSVKGEILTYSFHSSHLTQLEHISESHHQPSTNVRLESFRMEYESPTILTRLQYSPNSDCANHSASHTLRSRASYPGSGMENIMWMHRGTQQNRPRRRRSQPKTYLQHCCERKDC